MANRIEFLSYSPCCLLAFGAGHAGTLLIASLPAIKILILVLLASLVLARYSRAGIFVVFFLLGLLNACWHFSEHQESILPRSFERIDIEVSGKVTGLPNRQGADLRFDFQLLELNDPQLYSLVNQAIQLSCYRCPFEVATGDVWQFTVRLKRPRGFASHAAFDYEKFLFRHQISARGYVRLKSPYQRLSLGKGFIAQLRSKIKHDLGSLNGVGQGLVTALAIGDKSALNSQQKAVLQRAGISHLVAISGLHIGLIFAVIYALSNYLLRPFTFVYTQTSRQHLALFPALAAAVFYAALAGFAVSTQRALIMLLVFSLCRMWSRPQSLMQVLLYSAVIICAIDPFSILDAGFWLSFAAVFIIALFHRPSQASLNLVRLQPLLWLGMLPITASLFGQVSLIAPLVNLILVPLFCILLIPLTLFAVLLQQLQLEFIGNGLLSLLAVIYDLLYQALAWLNDFEFAGLYLSGSLWLCAFAAVSLLAVSVWSRIGMALRFLLLLLAGLSCLNAFANSESSDLRVTLLDVGQGLSMVVTKADYTLVYDTGPRYRSGFSPAQAVLVPFLREQGRSHINDLVISHADNDHIGGYQTLRQAFSFDRLHSSRQDKLPNSSACRAGQHWHIGRTQFSFLSPSEETPKGSNNWSCVLRIEHHNTVILLTGDIEKQVERYLLSRQANLKADVLLVPHQGSKTSSTADFIDAVEPSTALLAAGYKNQYGHPHQDVSARYQTRGIKVLSTIEHGTIDLVVSPTGIDIASYRQNHRRFWSD